MPTVNEHYKLIETKIKELRQAIRACRQEHDLFAIVEFQSFADEDFNANGKLRNQAEFDIKFDSFAFIGNVANIDKSKQRALDSINQKLEREDKKSLKE